MNEPKSRGKPATGLMLAASLALTLTGIALSAPAQSAELSVFKSPWCGCCGGWIEEMKAAGHSLEVIDMEDLTSVKTMAGVPDELLACHTALVEGYVIEGHVPVVEVERFLAESPDARGIAVAGMPMGAPGMGGPPEPFDVMIFNADGSSSVYAQY